MPKDLLNKFEGLTSTILDNAYDAIIIIDDKGKVLSWNQRSTALFQWSANEAIGKDLCDLIIPENFHDSHNQGKSEFLRTGNAKILNTIVEISALRKDKTELPIELTVSATKWQDTYVFTGIIRDITEKKILEQKLQLIRNENKLKLEILLGEELAQNITDKTFCDLKDKGKNELDLIIEQFDLIFNSLKKFVSERTLREARGEIVIPNDQPIALTFTDVENFTVVTQDMQKHIIPVLAMYLENMCKGVINFKGDVEKFIGDAIFFYHHNEEDPKQSTNQNFDSILNMVELSKKLWDNPGWNRLFENSNWLKYKKIKARYGMHFGTVTAGPLKSTDDQHRLESTLMGDNVNLTSRIEGLAKKYGVYFLMTDSYWSQLSAERQQKCRPVDYVTVKGREDNPLKVYTIDIEAKSEEFLQKYNEGQEYYFRGEWEKGRTSFIEAAHFYPDDGPTQLFISRIEESKNYLLKTLDHLERRFLGKIPNFDAFKKNIEIGLIKEPYSIPRGFLERGGYWSWDEK
jgi:PAS domain S-box-containing protein